MWGFFVEELKPKKPIFSFLLSSTLLQEEINNLIIQENLNQFQLQEIKNRFNNLQKMLIENGDIQIDELNKLCYLSQEIFALELLIENN